MDLLSRGDVSCPVVEQSRKRAVLMGCSPWDIEESLLQVPSGKWHVASPWRVGEVVEQSFLQKTPASLCLPQHSHSALAGGRFLSVGVSTIRRTLPCGCHLPACHLRPVNLRNSGFLHCCCPVVRRCQPVIFVLKLIVYRALVLFTLCHDLIK